MPKIKQEVIEDLSTDLVLPRDLTVEFNYLDSGVGKQGRLTARWPRDDYFANPGWKTITPPGTVEDDVIINIESTDLEMRILGLLKTVELKLRNLRLLG